MQAFVRSPPDTVAVKKTSKFKPKSIILIVAPGKCQEITKTEDTNTALYPNFSPNHK